MAVDKMWDVLRFLKSPQGAEEESPEKVRIDDRLIEALEAVEGAADAAARRSGPPSSAEEGAPGVPLASDARGEGTEETPKAALSEPRPGGGRSAPTGGEASEVGPAETSLLIGAVRGPAPAAEADAPRREFLSVPLASIRPNPFQPRMRMDEEEIAELAASIREVGLLQPVLVRPAPSGSGYELIAGERRWRAARLAELREIPAVVVEADETAQQLLALVENLQRKNLSAVEEAKCLAELIERTGFSQSELARRMGRSQAAVANKLRLLKLDPRVQQLVVDGKLNERQARSLLSLPAERQWELAERALVEELNARDLEILAEPAPAPAEPAPPLPPTEAEPDAPRPATEELLLRRTVEGLQGGSESPAPAEAPAGRTEVTPEASGEGPFPVPVGPAGDPGAAAPPPARRKRGRPRKDPLADPEPVSSGGSGPTGELLHDLALLINRHRGRGLPARWKVREVAQNALVVEIVVDLRAGLPGSSPKEEDRR